MIVVFATSSDIEASVVMALLDSHGIEAIRASGSTQGIWPMTVSALGEIRVAVADSAAEDARRIIESHRQDVGSRVVRLRDEFDDLQTRIDYRFRDRGMLEHALTHKSRAAEDASGGVTDNESLEFLGDAVLGLVVADALFHQYPTYDEGQKSKIKAAVVSTQSLARHAEQLRLGEHLILGRGEEKTGGRFKQALLADAYEALIAAIYLDGGLEAAETFLRRELKDALDEGSAQTFARDYKSALQERLQALGRPLPEYRVSGEAGPDHRKTFSVEVVVGGDVLGAATGRAKKEAEQEAAREALLAPLGNDQTPNSQRPMSEIDEGEVYRLIGEDGFARLVRAFYAQVPSDPILGAMYPAHDLAGAEQRLRDFLIGRFGGPPRYIEERGHPRLRMRHMPFTLDEAARDRWVALMNRALDEVALPADVTLLLREFFAATATFLRNA